MKLDTSEEWAEAELGKAALGHQARSKRLVRMGAALVEHPSASLPSALGGRTQAKAGYRLLSHPAVKPGGILSGHVEQTVKRCEAAGTVLLVQDTTGDSIRCTDCEGLGSMGDGGQGLWVHSLLCVSARDASVLGLLHQEIWARTGPKRPRGDIHRQDIPKESLRWVRGIEAGASALASTQVHPIAVMDAEADVFSVLQALDEAKMSFIIRVGRPRRVQRRAAPHVQLLEEARGELADFGERTLRLPSRPGHRSRSCTVRLSAGSVELLAPLRQGVDAPRLKLNVVSAVEEAPPGKKGPVEWTLLTREPIRTHQDVLAICRYYEARWAVEDFHMALKTGCACEKRQLESAEAQSNFIALASVIAQRLVGLRDAARTSPDAPATDVFTDDELHVLRGLRPRLSPKPRVKEAMQALASLGGFCGTTRQTPGWRTLWHGLIRLQDVLVGFSLAQNSGAR